MVEVFDRHGVEYLIVGGDATRAYGASRPAKDVDCLVKTEGENLRRLTAVLAAERFALSGGVGDKTGRLRGDRCGTRQALAPSSVTMGVEQLLHGGLSDPKAPLPEAIGELATTDRRVEDAQAEQSQDPPPPHHRPQQVGDLQPQPADRKVARVHQRRGDLLAAEQAARRHREAERERALAAARDEEGEQEARWLDEDRWLASVVARLHTALAEVIGAGPELDVTGIGERRPGLHGPLGTAPRSREGPL